MFKKLRRALKSRQLRNPLVSPLNRALTKEEKESLRAWIRQPAAQTALAVLAAHKPNPFVAHHHQDAGLIQMTDAARLHQIQGWETCFSQLQSLGEIDEPTPVVAEDYGV